MDLTRLYLTLIAAGLAHAVYVVYPPRYEISATQYQELSNCIALGHQENAPESRYDPICATDGFSYYNKHEMHCLSLVISSVLFAFYGRCPNEPMFLPLESARGTQFLGKPAVFESFQQCLETCLVFHPVCGSDDQTYSSPCAIDCAKKFDPAITTKGEGFCKQDKSVEGKCPEILQPFCGSDGITYLNYCHLRFAMMSEERLEPAHMGDCVRRLVAIEQVPRKQEKSDDGCGGSSGGCGCSGCGCGGCGK